MLRDVRRGLQDGGRVNEGPKVRVEASCSDCVHCRNDRYVCQGDSGFDVSCGHPDVKGDRRIGDTTWKTPAWCPFLGGQQP